MGDIPPEEVMQPDWYRLIRAAPVLGMSARDLFEWDPIYRTYWIDRAIATENVHTRVEKQQRAWGNLKASTGTLH